MKPDVTNILFILLAFNGRSNPSILAAAKQIHSTFSFLCQDQIVKVDSNIYHFDRLNSSLKSEYFEKLFTSEHFKRENDPILEIRPLNNEVFPAIIELIHGKEVQDVLNKDSYFSVLKEMNHFGMKIDLKRFSDLIDHDLKSCSPQDAKIFELYRFIIRNDEFRYLLKSVLKYFSNHLDVFENHEILSSDVPLDHLIQIIKNLDHPNENIRYNVVQMCSKWLGHDMKNRLPHMAQLVRTIKLLHRVSNEMYTDFSKCLPSCDVDEQSRQKMISTCLFALVANGGKFYPTTPEKEYNYDSFYRYCAEESSDESETETTYERFVNDRNESVKLNEFRRNGDLYDITVRVGEKTYKLHRRVLESKSGYFRDIFHVEYAEAITQCNGTPKTCPGKDKEYLLPEEIDPLIFKDVINSLYGYENLCAIFERFEYKWHKIEIFLKIVHTLRLDELLVHCIQILTNEHQRISLQDVEQILNFAHGKPQYASFYAIHLGKHLKEKWPDIRNMGQLFSISLTVLKEMLNSSHYRFEDPHKILDICSKWTCHDIKGRYQFLPQIARVINPLCVVKDDEYTAIDEVAYLNTSVEELVRDKLWKILSSLSHDTENVARNTSTKLEKIPVFIALTNKEISVDILDADLNVIASISNSDSEPIYSFWGPNTRWDNVFSATLINGNLFILSNFDNPFTFVFLVYNFLLKKCFRLRSNLPRRTAHEYYHFYTLLNCNNEIYSCSNYGLIRKYSMQFDLWTTFTEDNSYKANLHYTSDGKTLYRMYEIPQKIRRSLQYVVEEYNLRNNSWSRVPGSPLIKNLISNPIRFRMVNDRDFIIFADGKIITSNRDVTGKEWYWNYHEIPNKYVECLAQYEDSLLLIFDGKFYRYYPTNGSLEFKKDVPEASYYGNTRIVAIDRHMDVDTIKQVSISVSP